MGFLDSLKSAFSGGDSSYDKDGYWLYVRCNRCGETIKTRIDLRNNLHQQDEGGYITRKTLVGNQLCFERIEVILHFDGNRRVVDREIARGEFITAEEFEQAEP